MTATDVNASAVDNSASTKRAAASVPPRIRRRNRLITSCLECRRRKLKCDKSQPCGNCVKFSRDCLFLAPSLDPTAQMRIAEIKEKMGSLEKTLEEDVARRSSLIKTKNPDSVNQIEGQGGVDSEDELTAPEDEKDLEPTPFAVVDAAYEDDAEDDDLVDLGVQLGRMRITERIGGFVRPKLSEELKSALAAVNKACPGPRSENSQPGASIGPTPSFIAPSSSFFFAPTPFRQTLIHFLPSKETAQKLIDHYFVAVHPLLRCVHRPSFERQHEQFWREIAAGQEPRRSFQAVVFAALLSAVISLPEEHVLMEYAVSKNELVENFKTGTEAALSRANFIRTTKVETIQAFVMYLLPLCRDEVSRAHSALTGTAIRLAECMGLHRDPSLYGLSPVEVHVRRLIWYQICFLDIRTGESTGPRPTIHAEDFDTKFPLDVDDADLESPDPPSTDSDKWTDGTISRIKCECFEMIRLIWAARPRIERRKMTLTSILGKVERFRAAMEKKYYPKMDVRIPIQRYCMEMYQILTLRMHIAVLHRYQSNPQRLMPDRLRNILMSSSTLVMEHAISLETQPAFKTWAWYCGAMTQYHIALLMLGEMYAKPTPPREVERIWKCLDYAFCLQPDLNGLEKVRYILGELSAKAEAYQELRRMRVPTAMANSDNDALSKVTQKFSENVTRSRSASVDLDDADAKKGKVRLNWTGLGPAVPHPKYDEPEIVDAQSVDSPEFAEMDTGNNPGSGAGASGAANVGFNMAIFSGASNVSPPPLNSVSPMQSDTGSQLNSGSIDPRGGSQSMSPGADLMLDIDWNEWDKIFPPEQTGGDLAIPPFSLPDFADLDSSAGGNGNISSGAPVYPSGQFWQPGVQQY